MAPDSLAARADELAGLIETRLGVGGTGLETKLRRAGRLLPRWLRREAARIVEAQRLAAHPKLARQTDPAALDKAFHRCERWLKSIDPSERRKTRVLGFLATNAANLLIVAGLFIAWLRWSGHL